MHISRRTALLRGSFFALGLPLALAACASGNPLGTTITVNLTGAQAEASAILQALNVVASAAATTLATATQVLVTKYLGELSAAVAAFTALPSGSATIASFANAVIAAIAKLIGVLPLAPATSLAISEGMQLLAALVAGLSAITVTSVSAPAASAVPGRISAPIPIPVS